MSYLNFKSEYDRFPKTTIKNHKAFRGYDEIYHELNNKMNNSSVVVFDYYPGVDEEEVYELIKRFNFSLEINMHDIFKDGKTMSEQMKYNLTDDRVFGKMYYGNLVDFIDEDKLEEAQNKIKEQKESVIVYGVGAGLVSHGDVYVYFDMARWEIQLRYRKGMANYNVDNYDEDILKKYKRGYFIEWRIADKHKEKCFECFDYVVDTNKSKDPKMISKDTFKISLHQLSKQPFRTVPYFDPGVWGGQWMKEVCNLDVNQSNYAWSFDGVPEENSILFDYDGITFELPAMDLVLYQPKELLGEQVYARFGAEFPIRFDFLDTMEGQNLSLQVHPLTEYIKRNFGMSYTQDESYYILDAKDDAVVYLGLKEGIQSTEMIADLESAQKGEIVFDADKYINKFPAMKSLDADKKASKTSEAAPAAAEKVAEKVDFSNVKIEPLFEEMIDFDTFAKADYRAVKILECEAVPKSKKLLKFTLDDGTDRKRTILSGIHEYYEPEDLIGKTAIAIVNLPPRKMMGIDSEGMLISAVHEEDGHEGLNLLMVNDRIPAGAKLY